MPQAFCVHCRKMVEVVTPIVGVISGARGKRTQLKGKCPQCGGAISKFVKTAIQPESVETTEATSNTASSLSLETSADETAKGSGPDNEKETLQGEDDHPVTAALWAEVEEKEKKRREWIEELP